VSLGAATEVVGPSAGSNSVVVAVAPQTTAWTATTNVLWLHLSPANQSGTGSTNVIFSYDANPGATRSGTLTIAGQTLTVTQAASTYVAAATVILVPPGLQTPGVVGPFGAAVTGTGNVFTLHVFPIVGFAGIHEWVMSRNAESDMSIPGFNPNNLTSVGAANILATDSGGNLYIADIGSNSIIEWMPETGNVTNLVSSGLNLPSGVAVDASGNLYIADSGDNAIKEWNPATGTLTTLVSSGLNNPIGVAVDAAANVYIADNGNDDIKEWTAASGDVDTLVSSGLADPIGVAVDGAGNVYIADRGNAVFEWTACNGGVTTLLPANSGASEGVAVDGTGNLYLSGISTNWLVELPHAFVDPSPRSESPAGGSDSLPVVLPPTQNLLPPLGPVSDQPWLTITGIANGVVSFSVTATTTNRTAEIRLLNQSVPITQTVAGAPPSLDSPQTQGNGALQFEFTNTPGAHFTVLWTTNLSLPVGNWMVAGVATNISSNLFEFTAQPTTNAAQCFYSVRSP
jgi:hypothetical protein